jgi:hypothetical protein
MIVILLLEVLINELDNSLKSLIIIFVVRYQHAITTILLYSDPIYTVENNRLERRIFSEYF